MIIGDHEASGVMGPHISVSSPDLSVCIHVSDGLEILRKGSCFSNDFSRKDGEVAPIPVGFFIYLGLTVNVGIVLFILSAVMAITKIERQMITDQRPYFQKTKRRKREVRGRSCGEKGEGRVRKGREEEDEEESLDEEEGKEKERWVIRIKKNDLPKAVTNFRDSFLFYPRSKFVQPMLYLLFAIFFARKLNIWRRKGPDIDFVVACTRLFMSLSRSVCPPVGHAV